LSAVKGDAPTPGQVRRLLLLLELRRHHPREPGRRRSLWMPPERPLLRPRRLPLLRPRRPLPPAVLRRHWRLLRAM
jgi:hypothetical protein